MSLWIISTSFSITSLLILCVWIMKREKNIINYLCSGWMSFKLKLKYLLRLIHSLGLSNFRVFVFISVIIVPWSQSGMRPVPSNSSPLKLITMIVAQTWLVVSWSGLLKLAPLAGARVDADAYCACARPSWRKHDVIGRVPGGAHGGDMVQHTVAI